VRNADSNTARKISPTWTQIALPIVTVGELFCQWFVPIDCLSPFDRR
jgi:hypothetical protein